jgi:hypothetical protein
VIILGSGASIPHGIRGMDDLATWLRETVTPEGQRETEAWLLVRTALANGDHLEASMEDKQLPDTLVDKVVRATWHFIAQDDYSLLKSAVRSDIAFPLTSFFRGLFRSTARSINVVTTNYDRVTEYATDMGGYIHHTGFLPGYIRKADGADKLLFKDGNQSARTVEIWKVHGSLDWFIGPNGVLSLPMTGDLPEGLTPLIVTPGVSKYQKTYDEPFRRAIQGADRALKSASAFVCLGYGFRDGHIHPELVRRCRDHDTPILVAARTLTPEAQDFLRTNAGRHYIAVERSEDGTKAYNRGNPDGVIVPGGNYWDLSELNELIGF